MNLSFVLFLMLPFGDPPIQIVREGFLLDMSDQAHVALVFESYKWFEDFKWSTEPAGDKHKVTFTATIDDAKVVADFHSKNRYSLNTGMKSMQLYSYYKLDKDKQKLRYTIHFMVGPGRAFKVIPGGSLGIQNKAGEWREVLLEDNKALVSIIEGIYRNYNPYKSLVLGLPFK